MKPKALVAFVDDEKELTEAYEELFESKYQIKTFNSAEKYLAFLDEQKFNPFAITVTDFKMSKINGIEMINLTYEKKLHCPYILLSGHVDQELFQRLVVHGTDVTLLEKPPDLKQLDQMIEKILNSSQRSA